MEAPQAAISWFGVWGAVLSTALALLKLWETFWKDRLRLSTTYSFDGRNEVDDEIIVVNLSNQVLQVSHWTLEWKPRFFDKHKKKIANLTPDDGSGRFTIDPKSEHTLIFSGSDKFDWGEKAADGRDLILKLFLFDRKRPIAFSIKQD